MNDPVRFRRLTLLYSILLISIVVAANDGRLPMRRILAVLPWADKLGHFFLIGALALLANLMLQARLWRLGPFSGLVGSLWVTVAVILEEVSQLFMARRAFEFADLGADLAGILCFGALARWWVARSTQRENPEPAH